jgi:hypothetical protein
MANLSNLTASQFHKTIIFGPSKTGKTRLAGRLASTHKLILIDGEQGFGTLLQDSNLLPEHRKNVTLLSIPDDGVTGQFFTTVFNMFTTIAGGTICDLHGKFNCPECTKAKAPATNFNLLTVPKDTIVVIDSLTQFTNSLIAYVCRGKPDDYQMQIQDWGKVQAYMERMFSVIQLARINLVAITHEQLVEYDDGKKRIVPVAGSSKFSLNSTRAFDHVVYTEQVGATFKASSGAGKVPNVITGSRANFAIENHLKDYSPLGAIYNVAK